jgi:hypothetical protein
MDERTAREIQEELEKCLASHERFLTSTSERWTQLKIRVKRRAVH